MSVALILWLVGVLCVLMFFAFMMFRRNQAQPVAATTPTVIVNT